MYKLSSNNTTYTIPLDSFDLNYLSKHYGDETGKVLPLWRVPNGENYYEFKLNAWRIPESDHGDDDADDLSSESQLCHLCNIHVPVFYTKQHNKSEKHANMKKIYDLMMLRGKNSDLICPSEAPPSKSCYYCEDCSLVVLKTNKESHEASYIHKKSLRSTNLIEHFLKFYSEDLSDNRNNNKIKNQFLQDYYNKFINRKNLSFKINVVNEDSLRIIVKENRLKINNNNFHGLVEADTEMICILCEVQVSRILKLIEQHIESKKHRKRVTRNIDDIHCIREVNDDFAHCILCNELVLLYRVAGHKMLSHHTANLNLAQGRKNRDSNENYIFSKETETNVFRKYLRDELPDNVCEDSTEESKEDQEIHNSFQISCDVSQDTSVLNQSCAAYIATNNFNHHVHEQSSKTYVEHINKKGFIEDLDEINNQFTERDVKLCESIANESQVSDVENIITNKENIKLAAEPTEAIAEDGIYDSDIESIEIPSDFVENIYYLMLETVIEKEIICKVCNVLMSNTDSNLYTHFNGDKHITKYNELLKTNRVTKAQNKFFCYSCKVSITSKNELEHIFGVKHRNKLSNDTDFERLYCEFCKVCISDSVQEHQNTEKHLQMCMADGDNIATQISENVESLDNTDVQTYDDSIDVSDTEAENIVTVAKTENIQAVFLKLHYHVTKTPNPYKVLCKICNLVLPNSVIAIETHIEGFYHTNKYDNLLASNRIEKDDNRFHCKICDVFVTVKNEIEHIAGYKHKSRLPGKKDAQNTDVETLDGADDQTDEEITPVSAEKADINNHTLNKNLNKVETIDDTDNESIEVSNSEPINVTLQYHSNYVTKTSNPSEVLCKICNVVLSHSVVNIDTHIQGFTHSNKYKTLLELNCLEWDENRFHCRICDVFIGNKNEIGHIAGSKHKSRLPEKIDAPNTDVDTLDGTDDEITPASVEEADINNHTGNKNLNTVETIDDTDNESIEVSNSEPINVTLATKSENFQADLLKYHSNYVTKTSKPSEVLCKICNVVLSHSVVNIDTHIRGFTHSNKYKTLLESNCIEWNENRFHCRICDVFLSNKNEIEHIAGFKHKSRLPEKIDAQNTDVDTLDGMDDQTDDEITPLSDEEADINNHTVETIDDTDNESIEVSNSEPINVTLATKSDNFQADLLKYHSNYVTKTSNPSEVLCKICNVVLSHSVVNIDTHIRGFAHSNKYKTLLELNCLEWDENRFHCRICDVFIGNKNEIEHIFGFKHKSKLPKETTISNDIHCDECDKYIPQSEIESHLQTMEHFKMKMNKYMEAFNKSFEKFEENLKKRYNI